MKNRYYYRADRDFANEYTVARCTREADAARYETEGFERISRAEALKRLRYRGDAATRPYVIAHVDHEVVYRDKLVDIMTRRDLYPMA